MKYFRELPNLEVINTTKNQVSNDETLIVKNLFKRAKIREDLLSVFTAFDYYYVQENERPDQLAERVYGDPELDWVILLANNIINVQDQWPISKDSFISHLLDKYGSEEELYTIKHYETLELRDSFNRVVLPSKLIVDEAFYNSPAYQGVTTNPPGVTFPPIYVPGTVATATATLASGGSISAVTNLTGGSGYQAAPEISVPEPPVTINAYASCLTNQFQVTQIVGFSSGKGYNFPPTVTVSSPPESILATATCELGTGIDNSSVTTITGLSGGVGYGLTAPTVTFDPPSRILYGLYLNGSSISIGSGLDGMYVRNDGLKVYSSSGIGTSLIREHTLSSSWNVNTISYTRDLNVTADFSYCTGIEFSLDGTKMYVSGGQSSSYKVIQYNLSIPWNLLTASKTYQISTNLPGGIRFSSDGTKYYFLYNQNPDILQEYVLSTPWDLTTISGPAIATLNVQVITNDTDVTGFSFFDSGTKLLVTGGTTASIYEFNLSTAWDISTASLVNQLFIGDKFQLPSDIFIKPDRTSIFICGGTNDGLYQYNLYSTAKATATISNSSVTGINITQTGYGYTAAPNVTISSPYPAVTSTINATLSSGGYVNLTITNSGFGYISTPTVTIDAAPVSRRAVFQTTINSNTQVSSVRIVDPGSNYLSVPTLTFDSPADILNVEVNDIYNQSGTTWRWNGTVWEEKIEEGFQYLEPTSGNIVSVPGTSISVPISNYEYEIQLNEEKRKIVILKPQYLSLVMSDLKRIMQYDPLSENYINPKLKKTYNPKLTGV